MTKFYTGIGSRKTSDGYMNLMYYIAKRFSSNGNWVLRSGGADGADTAFESGADKKEIYLPWKGFNDNLSELYPPSEEAYEIASHIHPFWYELAESHRALHARNIHQVLGLDLETPSKFVICWTPDGARSEKEISYRTGGTATAITLASRLDIPVYNLYHDKDRKKVLNIVDSLD